MRHEGLDLPLLIGSYVTVELHGRTIDDAVVIPRRALREVYVDGAHGSRPGLWIMDGDDRLEIREAEVVWRGEAKVLLANHLDDGERLVLSTLATPIEGMKLALATTPEEPGGAPAGRSR